MDKQRPLESERLLFRELIAADAPHIQILASDKRVAEMTARILHPYPEGAAIEWIAKHESLRREYKEVNFAIILKSTQLIIGCIGLVLNENRDAELGYWVGVEHWGNGYATEAVKSIILFSFNELGSASIKARVLSRNPASGKVLLKCGLQQLETAAGSCGSKFESLDYYEIQSNFKQ